MPIVYLDMDGVLVNFDKFVIDTIGKPIEAHDSSEEAWALLSEHQNMFKFMEPMPDAEELVHGISSVSRACGFHIAVLTALPKLARIPNAKQHKKEWLHKHFPMLLYDFNIGPHAIHKQYHCNPGDILIDDNHLTIPQWRSQGGHGILHTSAKASLEELIQIFEM